MLKKQCMCVVATVINLVVLLLLIFSTSTTYHRELPQAGEVVVPAASHADIIRRLMIQDSDRSERYFLQSPRKGSRRQTMSPARPVNRLSKPAQDWNRVNAMMLQNAVTQAKHWFYRLLKQPEYSCPSVLRLGSETDGGYDVCVSRGFQPKSSTSSCLVYSFGIGSDFSFDDSAVTKLGCQVYSFDPYVSEKQEEGLRRKNSWFYRWGVRGSDNTVQAVIDDKQMYTFEQIRSRLNHTEREIDVLKIDIEGSEWSVLEEVLSTQTSGLENIRQIVAEIHSDELDKSTTTDTRWQHLLTILLDMRRHGFYMWRANENELGNRVKVGSREESCCFDVAWINQRFIPD